MGEASEKLAVTILYFTDDDLRLKSEQLELPFGEGGRVIVPAEFRKGKQIIGVLEGHCKILNRIGDRIFPIASAKVIPYSDSDEVNKH